MTDYKNLPDKELMELYEYRKGILNSYHKLLISRNRYLQLLDDMEKFLERVAPRKAHYQHNDFSIRTVNMTEEECPNGHAHCANLLLSTSETIPIVDGELYIGRWQSSFLIELDHARSREIVVQIIGQ